MIKKYLNIVLKIVFSRTMITILLMAVQISWLLLGFWLMEEMALVSMLLISGILLIYIINKDETPEFKLAWVIPICMTPVFGALLYLFIMGNLGGIGLKKGLEKRLAQTSDFLKTAQEVKEEIYWVDGHMAGMATYVEKVGGYPIYRYSSAAYFGLGEEMFADLLLELEKAEDFIFLEYFIVEEGKMWNSILEILERKAAEGVEVRFMYDGMCSLLLLPYSYPKKLEKKGIHTKAFSPIIPLLSTSQNNRDHRKILVIDGRVAYTGGINLADEYINETVKYGHWKDVAIRVEGEAVTSFTLMFLQMWNVSEKGNEDYLKYIRKDYHLLTQAEGWIMPYGDGPANTENVAETIYMDIIHQAVRYVHIMTPYFIVDNAMLDTLQYAARRGVEVRIIIPHIPDKKTIFAMSRTFYTDLLEAGVEVYEYQPGFVHGKVFISDDEKAVVGTVNLDYRSLYHHFECACFLYRCPVIQEVEADFQRTLATSMKVDLDYYKKIPLWERLLGRVLRLVAPLT